MNYLLRLLIALWLGYGSLPTFAQVPQQFGFQGVARSGPGQPIGSQTIRVRLTIYQGSINGNTVYQEIHAPQTANTGVFTIPVGGGTTQTGSFGAINWSAGPYFLQVESDVTGGSNYTLVSTSPLLSTPYALVATNLSGVHNPQNDDMLEYQNGAWSSKPKIRRYHVTGSGFNPYSDLQFIGPIATITVEKDNPVITINITKVLGSTMASGGTGLKLNLGYRKLGSAIQEFEADPLFGLRVAPYNRIPFTCLGTYPTQFKAGETYEIGIVGSSTNFSSWNDNGSGKGYVDVSY